LRDGFDVRLDLGFQIADLDVEDVDLTALYERLDFSGCD